MKTRNIIATVLTIIGFVILAVSGELTDIKLLVLTDIADTIKTEFRAVWHLISVDFFFSAFFFDTHLSEKYRKQKHVID